jgi:hypothetical protein
MWAPLLPDLHRLRNYPYRLDAPRVGRTGRIIKQERHPEGRNMCDSLPLTPTHVSLVSRAEIAKGRADAEAVLGAKTPVSNGDAPHGKLGARPFANRCTDRRLCLRASQVNLQCRIEHTFGEQVDESNVLTTETGVQLIDGLAEFNRARFAGLQKELWSDLGATRTGSGNQASEPARNGHGKCHEDPKHKPSSELKTDRVRLTLGISGALEPLKDKENADLRVRCMPLLDGARVLIPPKSGFARVAVDR